MLTFSFGFSQTINKPSRSAIVCLGTDLGVVFSITGTFTDGSEFEVQLSDKFGSFSNYTTFSDKIPYVSTQSDYSKLFLIDGIDESVDYKVRIRSTDPVVLSPESDSFRVIQNDPFNIMADGPTEFCVGGSVILKSSSFVDTKSYSWYKKDFPNDEFLGTGKTWNADRTGEYYALSTGNCVEESQDHIHVKVTTTPTSVIAEAETDVDNIFDVCKPGTFTFNANSTGTDNPYYEWIDSNGNVVKVGSSFTTGEAGVYFLRTINYGGMSVGGGGCPDDSDPVTLVVHDFLAEIIEQPNNPIIGCEGTDEVLTANITNHKAGYIYHWFKDNVEITGLTQPATTLDLTSVVASNGTYKLEVETPACTKTSGSVVITFVLTPTSQITPNTDEEICLGEEYTFTEDSFDKFGITTYQWIKDGVDIVGATNSTYKTGIAGIYTLRTTNDNICSDVSNPVELKVKEVISEIAIKQGALNVCEGSPLVLESSVEKDLTYIYHWYLNGVEITGLTQPAITYTVKTGVLQGGANSGSYTLKIESTVCSDVTSLPKNVLIKPLPIFDIAVNNQYDNIFKGCKNETINLVSSLQDTDYTFLWTLNGASAPGVNNLPTYSFNLTSATKGEYKLNISFAGDCEKSSQVEILLVDTPTSVIDPSPEAIACKGSTATLTALSTGNIITYEWLLNGAIILGETSAVLEASVSGEYKLRTTSDGTCSTLSSKVDVIISEIPESIITDPGYLENCTSVKLEVGSDLKGEDITRVIYEWYDENDVFIQNGTELIVTIEGTHTYKLKTILYATCSDITSVVVTIKPYESVIVGSNGENAVTECIGTAFSLESKDTDANFTYAWYKDAVVPGSEIGTASKLDLTGLTTDAGDYILVINGYNCSKPSTVFNVVMVKTPVALIKDDGNNFSGCSDVLLESESTELEAPTTYKWYKGGILITGANSSTYLATESGEYTLEVSNKNSCSSTSLLADVIIDNLSAEIKSGTTKECLGHNIVLEAVADDASLYTYTWIEVVAGADVDIPGATNSTYTVVADVAKEKLYRVRVRSNASGCEKTSLSVVHVVIKDTPVASIVYKNNISEGCKGDFITLQSGVTTDPDYTYFWYKNGAATGDIGVEITVKLTNEVDDEYKLNIIYGSCFVKSTPVTVHMVKTPVSIVEPAGDQIVCDNIDVILNGNQSTDLEGPTYQWYVSHDNGANFAIINGATSLDFKVLVTGWYQLQVINNGNCNDFSNTVYVELIPTPIAKIDPTGDQSVCSNVILRSISENLLADEYVSYEWYLNDVLLPTVTTSFIDAVEQGDYYFIVKNKGACGSKSETVNVKFTEFEHEIEESPIAKECIGNDIILHSINTDEVNYEFAWYNYDISNFPLVDGDKPTFTVKGLKSNSGLYYLKVTEKGTACSKQSESVQVIIKDAPYSLIDNNHSTNCEGKVIAISSNLTDLDYDYTWYFKDTEIVEGGNYKNVNTPTLLVTMFNEIEGEYKVKVSIGSCDGGKSVAVTLEMDDIDPILDFAPGLVICKDGSVTLTTSTTPNNASSRYEWYVNGNLIYGEIDASLTVTKPGIYKSLAFHEGTLCSQFTDEVVLTDALPMGVKEDTLNLELEEIANFEAFGGDNYIWYKNYGKDNEEELQAGGDIFEVTAEGEEAHYQVLITNGYCEELVELVVLSDRGLPYGIQNFLTPNKDGYNDVWLPELPDGSYIISKGDEVTILNRQGGIVYKTNNYINTKDNAWGGTFNDGPALPAGTYYYVIKRKDKEPIMGSITIFR